MKKVLSLLVSFVFLQTQSWALSGGPKFQGNAASFTGTYAGVLIPEVDASTTASTGSASIGLFSLEQPTKGFASGTVVAFVNGAVFNGTIQGILDPDGGVLNGVIDATSTFEVTEITPVVDPTTGEVTFISESFTVGAQGNIQAEVASNTANASSATRIEGEASLDVFFNIANDGTPVITQTARFQVDGFKQVDPL
ncbi:MAG: hypothetical protein V4710_14730, partial [Verrucomicrobiota bacterium]